MNTIYTHIGGMSYIYTWVDMVLLNDDEVKIVQEEKEFQRLMEGICQK